MNVPASQRFAHISGSRGFTMVELLVSITIMVLITAGLVVQSSRSRSDLGLTNEAYDVALLVREAQVFGTAVREGESDDFNKRYGVSFDMYGPGTVVLFRDDDMDGRFLSQDEYVKQVILKAGNTIERVCGELASGDRHCSDNGDIHELTVYFQRPALDALIHGFDGNHEYQTAEIKLSTRDGKVRYIDILGTGQISVR